MHFPEVYRVGSLRTCSAPSCRAELPGQLLRWTVQAVVNTSTIGCSAGEGRQYQVTVVENTSSSMQGSGVSQSRKHVLRKKCSSSNEQEYTEAGKLSSAHEIWTEASVLIHGQVSARRNWISPDLQSRPWICQGYSSATNSTSLNSNKKRQAAILQTPGPVVPLWPANRAGISWAALEPTVLDHRRSGETGVTARQRPAVLCWPAVSNTCCVGLGEIRVSNLWGSGMALRNQKNR